MRYLTPATLLTFSVLSLGAWAQSPPAPSLSPWSELAGPTFAHWTGLTPAADHTAIFSTQTPAVFRYSDGPRGFYHHGFRTENDSTCDWKPFYGVRCEVRLDDPRALQLTVSLLAAAPHAPDTVVSAVVQLFGAGWHTITLPWSAFFFDQAGAGFLRFGKGISLAARFADGQPGQLALRNVRIIRAPAVALDSPIRGKSAPQNSVADYIVQVGNCTDQPESIALSFIHYGWEVMNAAVEPATLQLAPGQSATCTVRVHISPRVPPGGHEQQILQAIANGNAAAAQTLAFITTSELPHPYIMHTPAGWQAVRDKVAHYPWAKAAQDRYLHIADTWRVPEVARPPHNDPDDNYGPFLFATQNENSLLACGYAWQITHDQTAAEKVATFLRRLSDPQTGYPATLRGCNQSLVQEGHFFQHIAMAYDMIRDAGILSDADRAHIQATFRLFMATIEREDEHGSINNWNLSETCGAFYCALAMQDLVAADRFFSGPSGIKQQLAKGTMDDGWWYECSISYNMWCASEFTQAALAYQPFGYNFTHEWVPASYSPNVLLSAQLNGGNGVESPDPEMKNKPFGMDPTVYGPTTRPYRTITDLWNSLLPFIDYRDMMFGVNDSAETLVAGNRPEVSGQPFEIAYYAFHDPRYAALIKRGGKGRDLLYGIPELPSDTPEQFRDSAYSDNVGLVMLRSQTPNRPISDQIQAVLHYGTHGWAHGHFDRTDLLSIMRYGRSFWNPEAIWYGYACFMYKFYVQTSVNHNMVVVDQKMQQATPGTRLLFHTGRVMQATAVETTARWSNPPYGGMVYDYVPVKTFAAKTWLEGRYVPIPKNPPAYGTLTDFTEPILQRRLMVVTDDYILIADYDQAAKPHTFDNLISMKGFLGLDAPQKQFLRHDAQWNPDPLSSAQFVTDCNWYSVHAPAVARFSESFGPGADNAGFRTIGNTDGTLKIDVHSLWPPEQQIMVATAPEEHNTEKRLYYSVRGDGKTFADGKFGAWILGQGNIDVPLDGVKHLDLETTTELSQRPTLFWADARIITNAGKKIPLAQLPVTYDNILPAKGPDQDYLGGPVKIAGNACTNTLAAEPKDAKHPGLIHIDLTGVDAVRLKAIVGSDYPPGKEGARRKTYAIRSHGTTATFLTLIEPYDNQSAIRAASAADPDHIHVELTDGRAQDIAIHNLEGTGKNIQVTVRETKNGETFRTETTTPQDIPVTPH